jgi:hypothetical protein
MLILLNEITNIQSLLVHQQVSRFKFDSIKSTIDQPITPLAFIKTKPYCGCGSTRPHLSLSCFNANDKKSESTEEKKEWISQFDYFDNKLYRKKKSYDTSIKAGSEVIAVNGINHELNSEIQPLL